MPMTDPSPAAATATIDLGDGRTARRILPVPKAANLADDDVERRLRNHYAGLAARVQR